MDSHAQEDLILLEVTEVEIRPQSYSSVGCLCPSFPLCVSSLFPSPESPSVWIAFCLSLSLSLTLSFLGPLIPLFCCLLLSQSVKGRERHVSLLEGLPIYLPTQVAELSDLT